jgi:hypothetical protein
LLPLTIELAREHGGPGRPVQEFSTVPVRYIDVTLSLGAPATTISPGQPGLAMPYLQDPVSHHSLLSHPLATHIRRDPPPRRVYAGRPICRRRPRSCLCI